MSTRPDAQKAARARAALLDTLGIEAADGDAAREPFKSRRRALDAPLRSVSIRQDDVALEPSSVGLAARAARCSVQAVGSDVGGATTGRTLRATRAVWTFESEGLAERATERVWVSAYIAGSLAKRGGVAQGRRLKRRRRAQPKDVTRAGQAGDALLFPPRLSPSQSLSLSPLPPSLSLSVSFSSSLASLPLPLGRGYRTSRHVRREYVQ